VAAAALDQKTFEGMQVMGRQETGEDIPFFAAWGTSETAPCATLVYWRADDIRVIGLPIPGTTLKLVADEANRYEVRLKGPNITKGYYNNRQATAVAFDEEGYYYSGDAVAFLDEQNPNAGLIFDGRIGEDFKLTSGVWVRNAHIRANLNNIGKPYIMEVVLAAPNKPYLNALIVPNMMSVRGRFAELSDAQPTDADFLHLPEIVALFRTFLQEHNRDKTGSSQRIVRFTILTQPLQFDRGEATDKGYINQRAVLKSNAALVERFYGEQIEGDIWEV
jgi:feruloyl-CoA synthase